VSWLKAHGGELGQYGGKKHRMKKSWSSLILIGMLALAFGLPAWAEELKIAVVEPQKVLEATKAGRRIKDSLADYVKTRQRLLDSEAEDLKKIEEDLVKQGAGLSAETRQEKEGAFRQKVAAYQRRVQDLEGEVQAKKAEVLGEFTKSLEQVVQEIAEKEKISLVMQKGAGDAGTLVIFNHPSVDLTDRVIKALDSRKGD
jgi:outer membrane protein